MTVLLPQLILTAMVYVFMYSLLYPPQAVIAIFFNGPTGLLTAWLAMIHQSAVVASMLSRWLLLPTPLRMMFEAILTKEGLDDLVVRGRARRVYKPSLILRIRTYIQKMPRNFLIPLWFIKSAGMLLLHFIPILGPMLAALLAAPKRGRATHTRYFELKGYTALEIKHAVDSRRGQYTGFDISLMLQFVF